MRTGRRRLTAFVRRPLACSASTAFEPASMTPSTEYQDLSRLVNPASVALIGASDRPDSIGGRALSNLVDHSDFKGRLYLVNASRAEIRGRQCWPDVSALPETPELAVVAVPAAAAIGVLAACADRGVPFAIVVTSGFGEAGEAGKALELEMQRIAARSGMRIYGPNCPGLCNINARIGFTFSPSFPHDLRSGPIGLATQGGGLGRNVMQAMERGIGVGLWCSSGNEADLQVSDFIHYMADAPDIRVIVTLLEGIKDGRKFLAAVQRAARNGKPVVALKVGRSEYGQKAAQSHTASITGSAEVNSAAFRQLGVIEVDDIDELVDTAWLLARHAPPARGALAVYCSSGGAAALAADMTGSAGLTLATFAEETTATLRAHLPDYAGISNPVDTTTAVLTNPALSDITLGAVASDPNVALVLVPFTIEYGAATVRAAQSAVNVQAGAAVPILPVWMSDRIGEGFQLLAQAGMVPSRTLGKAVKAVRRWLDYGAWRAQADLSYRPLLVDMPEAAEPRTPAAPLTEPAAKHWLAQHGVPVPAGELARAEDEAVAMAGKLGYPVAIKIVSADITHKSDVGGVRIGLADAQAVRAAWHDIHASVSAAMPAARIEGMLIERMASPGGAEVLVGVSRDPVLGHVMTFGLGGVHVELFKDVSRRLLPLTAEHAAAMIREVKCYPLLAGTRGAQPCDIAALETLLMRVSDFVVAHADAVDEVELNPVWVGRGNGGAQALDAVILARAVDGVGRAAA
jgi:acyl-CoA synthetase (NDP forming)